MAQAQLDASAFPNPASTVLEITCSENTEIYVFNSMGNSGYLGKGATLIHVSDWKNGIYFVKFREGAIVKSVKVMVQNR